jgi:hypothetical protein
MTDTLPTISTAEKMLALLREKPSLRSIVATEPEGEISRLAVYEGNSRYSHLVAYLAPTGTAADLIGAVTKADYDASPEAWAALPLRFTGGACVLPEHPDAPTISSLAFETGLYQEQ